MIHHDQLKFTVGMQGWFDIWKLIKIIHVISRTKSKNQHDYVTDPEKAFDKKHTSFHT